MKQILKRALLPAIAISLMFVIPATAVEPSSPSTGQNQAFPNGISFQIPMHDFCSTENAFDFSFQLSNAAATTADVTLYLYHKDGSMFSEGGTSFNGIESTLLPGARLTLRGHTTELYHMSFGNQKRCDDRIYSGQIVVNSGQASLLAKGSVNKRIGVEATQSESITINENKSFELAK
jgi:hypothetical protein